MSNLPGLFVLGEANFSDHGANRLGASALMQGLADGYFVLPATISGYLATQKPDKRPAADCAEFKQAEENVRSTNKRLVDCRGKRTPSSFHNELGKILWEHCGMARNEASLEEGITLIRALRDTYWKDVNVSGEETEWNQSLEKAGRVADFFELAELLCIDALHREESCGGHFREEYQYTKDDQEVKNGLVNPGDVKRRDDRFAYVAAWEFAGDGKQPALNKEPLEYEEVHMSTRSYK
jgi:succinate dehydrogenase / fumarate reductase flavoprotein subunit